MDVSLQQNLSGDDVELHTANTVTVKRDVMVVPEFQALFP